MKQKAHDPAHWRQRAGEARKVAEQLDEASKEMMLEIAERYERVATLVEKHGGPPPQETEPS